MKRRLREALRPEGAGDIWIGGPPTRDDVEARLRGDPEARAYLFEWSMMELVEGYIEDERLQIAYLGQGVIGTNASPHDPGTASIHYHHGSGRMFGLAGLAVARIVPGGGELATVEIAGGEQIRARAVVANADPRATLKLLGDAARPIGAGASRNS